MNRVLLMQRYLDLEKIYRKNGQEYLQLVKESVEEWLPVIYTPTIGQVCQNFHRLPGLHRGGEVVLKAGCNLRTLEEVLEIRQPEVIVLTDGSRILGLGDLGANGVGISIGKCRLYQAAGGVKRVLPMAIDCGTSNLALREDPAYRGTKAGRTDPEQWWLDRLVETVFKTCPDTVLQFEDVAVPRCFDWLDRYRHRYRVFNDDIQGTAAVVLAGLINVARVLGCMPKVLLVGAGSSARGVAALWSNSSHGDADLLWMVDSKGVVDQVTLTNAAKKPFARDDGPYPTELAAIVRAVQPDVLVGLTGQGGLFDEAVLAALGEHGTPTAQRFVFALSNPTSCVECDPADALALVGKKGRPVMYASGTPYPGFSMANNAFIFPAVGKVAAQLGTTINEQVFVLAAEALAEYVSDEFLATGMLYPPVKDLIKVTEHVARQLVEKC